MFQTLDVLLSIGVIFLILSMINKYIVSFFKRFLNTKANVIANEMQFFFNDKTSKHLEIFLKKKGKDLWFFNDKESLGQLTKEQLKKLISELKIFIKNKDGNKALEILGLDKAAETIESEISEIQKELQNLKDDIENMYDSTIDKISEIYKKNIRYMTLLAGIILAVIINADFFSIYISLSNNPIMRKEIVINSEKVNLEMESLFEKLSKDSENGIEQIQKEIDKTKSEVSGLIGQVEGAGIVLGWTTEKFYDAFSSAGSFFYKLTGILLAGFLISFGAPFWHDFIGTFAGLRKVLKRSKQDNPKQNPVLP